MQPRLFSAKSIDIESAYTSCTYTKDACTGGASDKSACVEGAGTEGTGTESTGTENTGTGSTYVRDVYTKDISSISACIDSTGIVKYSGMHSQSFHNSEVEGARLKI